MPRKQIDVTCQCGETFQAYELGHFTRTVCESCVAKERAAEVEKEMQEAVLVLAKAQGERIRRAHIPVSWQKTIFVSSDSKIHASAFQACKNYAEQFKASSPSLIIHSSIFGSGKTHLAACIANYLLHVRHANVRFEKARDILFAIKTTYEKGSQEDENDVLNRLLSFDLLVIDDLGVDKPTDWTASTFWTMFDRRLEAGRPVVVTTNWLPTDEELGTRIGLGALSRLCGMCGDNIITFKGKDLRRGK